MEARRGKIRVEVDVGKRFYEIIARHVRYSHIDSGTQVVRYADRASSEFFIIMSRGLIMSRLIKRYNYLSRGVNANGRFIAAIHSKIESPARIGSQAPFVINLIRNACFRQFLSLVLRQSKSRR